MLLLGAVVAVIAVGVAGAAVSRTCRNHQVLSGSSPSLPDSSLPTPDAISSALTESGAEIVGLSRRVDRPGNRTRSFLQSHRVLAAVNVVQVAVLAKQVRSRAAPPAQLVPLRRSLLQRIRPLLVGGALVALPVIRWHAERRRARLLGKNASARSAPRRPQRARFRPALSLVIVAGASLVILAAAAVRQRVHERRVLRRLARMGRII